MIPEGVGANKKSLIPLHGMGFIIMVQVSTCAYSGEASASKGLHQDYFQ